MMRISTIPEGAHIPKLVALTAMDVLTEIGNIYLVEPKALISRLGWGKLTVYKSTLGTRKLSLNNEASFISSNDVIYRKIQSSSPGDWYILKLWYQTGDGLRLHTYAIGDCGSPIIVNLHEV